MSTLDFEEATDAILARFKTQWDADSTAVAGFIPPVEYDNMEPLVPLLAPWARVTVEHVTGAQSSLGATGNRIFDRGGLVTVQVFVVLGTGVTLAKRLGKIAVNAFEGKVAGPADDIWFRNVRMNEAGPPDKWFQVNVVAEFLYDTIK